MTINTSSEAPALGQHPFLLKILKDEALRLRQRAEEIRQLPLPPVPPGLEARRGFYGTFLEEHWAKAWRIDCAGIATTFGDAAHRLEQHAAYDGSELRDIVEWRK